MKQVKKLFAGTVLISIMFLLNSCGDGYKEFDLSQCKEVALQYLQEKYGEKFEVTDCWEVKKYIGSAGYVKVEVKKEKDDNDNKYLLIVYPKENKDENGDGYYDSYEVTSDDYMNELINNVIKEKIDGIFIDAGFPEFFSSMGMEIWDDREYKVGVTSSFVENDAYECSIEELFDRYKMYIVYNINILDENYNENMENEMTEILKDKISDDFINCRIYVYGKKNYNLEKIRIEQGEDYYVQEERKIQFFVEGN